MRAFPHEFVRCSASGGHDMGLLSKALSLRTSESPLVPASMPVGVKNAPSPEAGDGVTFPSKDNATASPSAGRLLSPLVM